MEPNNTFKNYLEGRLVSLNNQYQAYKIEEGKATDQNHKDLLNGTAAQIWEVKCAMENILEEYKKE